MSSTFTPQQAIDYTKVMLKNMPIERVAVQILNNVSSLMWMSAPWRWSIGTFPTVTLTSNTQDYTVAIPSDFLYIQNSYSTDESGNVPRIFHIDSFIPPGGKIGIPSRIALISGSPGSSGTIRVTPKPTTLPTPAWKLVTLYKKQAPVVTNKNLNTPGTLVFDDEWFPVFVSGILYYGYLFGDDQRAGGGQIDPSSNRIQFTGQRGIFEADLSLMKQRERLAGMDPVFPEKKDDGN